LIGGIIGDKLIDLLYPLRCVYCSEHLFSAEIPLCRKCYNKLKFVSKNVCEKCGRHIDEGEYVCELCKKKKIEIDFSRSCVYYDDISAAVIKRFKYSNKADIGLFISSVMYDKFLTELNYTDIEYITYIPFGYFKEYNRFYNHSKILAENLSELTGVPVCGDIISQNIISVSQAKLPIFLREKRPFMFCRGKKRIKAEKILLIDDVLTTGRTISDASKAIKKYNDVKIVCALTFAC